MTFHNRAADARLSRIEKALQSAENRLDAAIQKEDLGDETSNSDALHDEIRALVDEASYLRPVSSDGLASKARIAVKSYNLASVGQSILYSLVEDLQIKAHRRR